METRIVRAKPPTESIGHSIREMTSVARATFANVEALRNFRTRAAEVKEFVAQQDPVDPRVSLDVIFVRNAIGEAMVRISLEPSAVPVSVVDVVAESLFPASGQIGFLALVPSVAPIVVEGHGFRHPHGEYQPAFLVSAPAAGPYYPVPDFGTLSNSGFAGGQGADPEEGIRRKAVVSSDDIGEQTHGKKCEARQPQSWRTMSFGGRDSSGPRHSLLRPSIASMRSFPRQPTRASP